MDNLTQQEKVDLVRILLMLTESGANDVQLPAAAPQYTTPVHSQPAGFAALQPATHQNYRAGPQRHPSPVHNQPSYAPAAGIGFQQLEAQRQQQEQQAERTVLIGELLKLFQQQPAAAAGPAAALPNSRDAGRMSPRSCSPIPSQSGFDHSAPRTPAATGDYDDLGQVEMLQRIPLRAMFNLPQKAMDFHQSKAIVAALKQANEEDVDYAFKELFSIFVHLLQRPFSALVALHLIQNINYEKRVSLLSSLATRIRKSKSRTITEIASHRNGSRALMKFIDSAETPDERSLVISLFTEGDDILSMMMDGIGFTVVERLVVKFESTELEFIYNCASDNVMKLATDKNGCRVLRHLFQTGCIRKMVEIIDTLLYNCSSLVCHPFGNYTLQYLLNLEVPEIVSRIFQSLVGRFPDYARDQCGSNVVERVLQCCNGQERKLLIDEMVNSPEYYDLLEDDYANYVIQTALTLGDPSIHSRIVMATLPHLPKLNSSQRGKRILHKLVQLTQSDRIMTRNVDKKRKSKKKKNTTASTISSTSSGSLGHSSLLAAR